MGHAWFCDDHETKKQVTVINIEVSLIRILIGLSGRLSLTNQQVLDTVVSES